MCVAVAATPLRAEQQEVTAYSFSPKIEISDGTFLPLFGAGDPPVAQPVGRFLIDTYPVTNLDFKQFVTAAPSWQKSAPSTMVSDQNYLKSWLGNGPAAYPPPEINFVPVTNVPWFAADAFCRYRGGRLPTVLEWEYAAAANEKVRDASRDPEFVQQILAWYAEPPVARSARPVGSRKPNFWGVYDLHGLVWEWTSDFNSVFVSGDNRREGDKQTNLFCGAGAENASDRANYAAYVRYALRSSLRANYTSENLGFRCSYDPEEKR